jgi:hypothetical protein
MQHPSQPIQDTYLYRISPTRHALGLALCLALAIIVAYFAAVNKEGLTGFKSASFSVAEASIIFFGVAVLFLIGAICCVIMLKRSLDGPASLMLGALSLSAPRASLKGDMLSIPYTSINKVTLHSVQNQQMVVIDSAVGQSRVSSIGFASDVEFESFYQGLTAKVGRSQKT